MFVGSDEHAQSAAHLFSLIASARRQRLDPEAYLRDLLRVLAHWPRVPRCSDVDHDGMPDLWERAHGLDPNDAADGPILGADGYSNLERDLNGR